MSEKESDRGKFKKEGNPIKHINCGRANIRPNKDYPEQAHCDYH